VWESLDSTIYSDSTVVKRNGGVGGGGKNGRARHAGREVVPEATGGSEWKLLLSTSKKVVR